MASFAPNFTARYVVRYSVFSRQYSMQFRSSATSSLADDDIVTAAGNFLSALAPVRATTWEVVGALWYPVNQNVSVPAPTPEVDAGTANISGSVTGRAPGYWGFSGRTLQGQRASLYLYGIALTPASVADEGDWRLTAAENAVVDSAITELANAGALGLVGSDGNEIVWKPYVNLGFNSYQIRRARGA